MPARRLVGVDPFGDGGVLTGPEQVRVGENGAVAEQVGQDMPVIDGKIEQRRLGEDARAARQPCFQAFAARGPAAQPGEVGLDRRFIQKDNTFRCPSYGWQAV